MLSGSIDTTTCFQYYPQPTDFHTAAHNCNRLKGSLPWVEKYRFHRFLSRIHSRRELPITWSASSRCVFLTRDTIRQKDNASLRAEVEQCYRNERAPYFCLYDTQPALRCGNPSWRPINGHCYKRIDGASPDTMYDQEQAQQACASQGANLASVHTRYENLMLTWNFLSRWNDSPHSGAWIGLKLRFNWWASYVTEASWVDGAFLSSDIFPEELGDLKTRWGHWPWKAGVDAQPNPLSKRNACVHIWNKLNYAVGRWSAADCDYKLHAAICKKSAMNI